MSKTCMILPISSLENSTFSKRVLVVQVNLNGSLLLFFITEHCFAKNELKKFAFSLNSVTNLLLWRRGGIKGIFFVFQKSSQERPIDFRTFLNLSPILE